MGGAARVFEPFPTGPVDRSLSRDVRLKSGELGRLGILALLAILAVALASALRIEVAEGDPGFDGQDARGSLRSDPALLYYLTTRLVENGGEAPDDWRQDPRIEFPDRVDIPAVFTVGQEYLVAWSAKLATVLGISWPLHVLTGRLMALLAATTGLFVLLAAWETSRSLLGAALALALYLTSPASYRTIGFLLVREDLSLPLLALHWWLVARAVRTGGAWAYAGAGLAMGAALATWHGASFLLLLEMLCAALVFLRGADAPFASNRSRLLPIGAILLAVLVPALVHKGTLLSPTYALIIAGFVSSLAAGRAPRPLKVRAIALIVTLLVLALARFGSADLAHVWTVAGDKLRHAGVFPEDPSALAFESRLMWQGPFETLQPGEFLRLFQLPLLLALPGALYLCIEHLRGRCSGLLAVAAWLVFASLIGAWFARRVSVVGAVLFPIVASLTWMRIDQWRRARLSGRRERSADDRSLKDLLALWLLPAGGLAIVLQLVAFSNWHAGLKRDGLVWSPPASRRQELLACLRAVEEHVPPGEAVAADFMLSPAILAHTGRPIVLQPKWETRASRERVRAFWDALYHGTPEDMRRLLNDEFACSWLLVDPTTLWTLRASRRLAGLKSGESPPDGSMAEALFTQAPARAPAGFRTVWLGSGGQRLLRISPDD